jgi:Mn2+/Fe2+ NRAMP family transporter
MASTSTASIENAAPNAGRSRNPFYVVIIALLLAAGYMGAYLATMERQTFVNHLGIWHIPGYPNRFLETMFERLAWLDAKLRPDYWDPYTVWLKSRST